MPANGPEQPQSTPPLAERLLRGSLWTVAMRWGVRFIGIISTLILVRLLDSADFGLVAMAMAIITLIDYLTDFGANFALLRDKDAGRAEFDTAWTIRFIQLYVVGALTLAVSHLAADFYDDPRVEVILQVLALNFFIRGLENIGIVEFQRKLQFHRDFSFSVTVKVVGVITTIGIAWVLRSYWALVFGMIATSTASVALSYWFSDYRPRFSFAAREKIWGFSQWMLVSQLANYIRQNGPIVFLGRMSTAEGVGYYSVSREVSSAPTAEVAMPVSRAVLPGLAQLTDEPERLNSGYLKALSAVASIIVPMGFGIAAVADSFVHVILGSKWLPTVVLIQLLAMQGMLRALASITQNLIMVIGRVRYFAVASWISAALLLIGLFPAYSMYEIAGVAGLAAIMSGVFLILLLRTVVISNIAGWKSILMCLGRPVVAALAMVAVLAAFDLVFGASPWYSDSHALRLALKVVTGAAVYGVVLVATWLLASKPDGLEALVWERLAPKLRRGRSTQ